MCVFTLLDVCFVLPPISTAPPIFGFAQFMTALALLVVMYNITDVRYRFRLLIAPLPLHSFTYIVLVLIGLVTLTSDLVFAEQIPVPSLLDSRAIWQSCAALTFLVLAMVWIFFAFIHPPLFSRWNAERYARHLFRAVTGGLDSDLAIIVNELARSSDQLVGLSRGLRAKPKEGKKDAAEYAFIILLLLGNRKVCRTIIASSASTASAFFDAMTKLRRYDVPVGQFSKNLSAEALANKDSPMYHEESGYRGGLLGYWRPFMKSVYGNYGLVEALGRNHDSPLDIDYQTADGWDSDQLDAYCRAVLITVEDYIRSDSWGSTSSALHQAIETIEGACGDIYKLDQAPGEIHQSDVYRRFNAAVRFIKDAVRLLSKKDVEPIGSPRTVGDGYRDLCAGLSKLMLELVIEAARVKGPFFTSWTIQHNALWGEFVRMGSSKVGRFLLFRLRRNLYNEVIRMDKLPDFRSARALAICLNVMGLELGVRDEIERPYLALKIVLLNWTRKNYRRIWNEHRAIAETCLTGGITYDPARNRLTKTYGSFLGEPGAQEHLDCADA